MFTVKIMPFIIQLKKGNSKNYSIFDVHFHFYLANFTEKLGDNFENEYQ